MSLRHLFCEGLIQLSWGARHQVQMGESVETQRTSSGNPTYYGAHPLKSLRSLRIFFLFEQGKSPRTALWPIPKPFHKPKCGYDMRPSCSRIRTKNFLHNRMSTNHLTLRLEKPSPQQATNLKKRDQLRKQTISYSKPPLGQTICYCKPSLFRPKHTPNGGRFGFSVSAAPHPIWERWHSVASLPHEPHEAVGHWSHCAWRSLA